MKALYEHDKVKALVNIAHGEGFGLPLFEAARSALPIIAVGWSGQMDFLSDNGKEMFLKVKHQIGPVSSHSIWKGVIDEGANWAYADQGSYKMALRQMHKNYADFMNQAEELQAHVDTNFRDEVLFKGFCDAIWNPSEEELEWIQELSEIEIL